MLKSDKKFVRHYIFFAVLATLIVTALDMVFTLLLRSSPVNLFEGLALSAILVGLDIAGCRDMALRTSKYGFAAMFRKLREGETVEKLTLRNRIIFACGNLLGAGVITCLYLLFSLLFGVAIDTGLLVSMILVYSILDVGMTHAGTCKIEKEGFASLFKNEGN